MEKKLNLHFRRFEFKYLVPTSLVDRMVPEMMNYMEYDPYAGEDDYYINTSLYMDSANLRAYHEKIDGLYRRKKLRIRSYSGGVDEKMFFEIKRREGDIVLKDRAVVTGKEYQAFFDRPFSLQDAKGISPEFAEEFIYEYMQYQMSPKYIVRYKRKPFFSKFSKDFRVTFDYDLEVAPGRTDFQSSFKSIWHNWTVLEVKFNGNLPGWFHDIINLYKLDRLSFCKYCEAVEAWEPQRKMLTSLS